MKKLNNTTKKALGYIYNYKNSNDHTLNDVYRTYSNKKEKSYYYCRELMKKYDGYNFKITSHNCDFFSAAFTYDVIDNVTGVVTENLCYITPSQNYTIEL